MGPLTGIAVGLAQTTAALLCWLWHGQPDFYFRGWSGVQVEYQINVVAGAFAGLGYGVVLSGFELLTRKRVRLWLTVPIVIAFGFIIAAVVLENQFRRQTIDAVLMPQILSIASAKRDG
jgi:hypothetical protein